MLICLGLPPCALVVHHSTEMVLLVALVLASDPGFNGAGLRFAG